MHVTFDPLRMLHVAAHLAVPVVAALAFYRQRWRFAALILLATMLVDLDHLLADPIYDPERCSIGFHPLHTAPAIALYAAMFAVPWVARALGGERGSSPAAVHILHLAGLGLLIHMALDFADCLG